MSDKKKVTKVTETEKEKVMTKYDRKMQKRKEEAEKAKREERKSKIIGIAIVALLAAFILSFPIRSAIGLNGTYIKVGDEKVTRLEFDFNYALIVNSYIEQNSYYLSMMGATDVESLKDMTYSGDLTFDDYFTEAAVDGIRQTMGLKARAEAEGFTHDTTEEMAELKTYVAEQAELNGITEKKYLQAMYGSLATWSRLEPLFEENYYVSAYYQQVYDNSAPTEEELEAEYEANKSSYDSVDYRLTIVEADLPTAAPDGTVEKDDDGNEIAYEPTEEEIAAVMADAKKEAEAAEATVAKNGTIYENVTYDYVETLLQEFLFDESREEGDTTVVEDAANNRYLVASFDGRYRDETNSVDVRMIYSTETSAEDILEEWENGEATEESFTELVSLYDEYYGSATGGLYEGLSAASADPNVEAWLTDGTRESGDVAAITATDGSQYTVYYIGENEPIWKLDAKNTVLLSKMESFINEVIEGVEVEDPKGKLDYLKAAEESSEETVGSDTAE